MNRNHLILIVEILSVILASVGVMVSITSSLKHSSTIPGICVAVGGITAFVIAQYLKINQTNRYMVRRPRMIQLPTFNTIDIIALVCIIGCFVGIVMGHSNDVLAILTTVVGFYFGRVTADPAPEPEPPDEDEELR